jgi:2-polyprenyl-6-methoxyphenol hydroxylase-like FAD-dependent oxidoreductase
MPTDHHSPARGDDNTYDVIVVGARGSGAATATLLARGALRTLLIDQLPRADAPLTAVPLTRAGVLMAARFGVLDDLVAEGTPPVQRTTFRYGTEVNVMSFKRAHGIDALYAPRTSVMEPLLVRAALASGVDVISATTVTDLIVRDGRVAGVRTTRADGLRREFGAALVIGADGIDSIVAARVEARFTRFSACATAVVSALWRDLPADGFEWNFHPDVCSGVIPTNNGVCVFAAAAPARVGAGGIATMSELVAAGAPSLYARLQRGTATGVRTWSGRRGFIRKSAGRGWALVGAAGYFKNPASAHGCTDAFRDAALLADAVLDGFGDNATLDDALAYYEITRNRIGVPLFDAIDRIAGGAWDETEIAELVLQCNSAMANEVDMLAALEPGAVP